MKRTAKDDLVEFMADWYEADPDGLLKTNGKLYELVQKVRDEGVFQFAPASDGVPSLADDSKIGLLTICIAHQQAAGFGIYIDAREFKCPSCQAPGFNTGFGYFKFTCGAEVLTVDGDFTEACPSDEGDG